MLYLYCLITFYVVLIKNSIYMYFVFCIKPYQIILQLQVSCQTSLNFQSLFHVRTHSFSPLQFFLCASWVHWATSLLCKQNQNTLSSKMIWANLRLFQNRLRLIISYITWPVWLAVFCFNEHVDRRIERTKIDLHTIKCKDEKN